MGRVISRTRGYIAIGLGVGGRFALALITTYIIRTSGLGILILSYSTYKSCFDKYTYCGPPECSVGWSDLALYCDFRKATRFCWSSIFLGGQFQKIGKFRSAKFSFSKIRRKYDYFFENLQNPSLYIKEQSPRRKFEIKSCSLFFKNSQKWSNGLLSVQGKFFILNLFSFCL